MVFMVFSPVPLHVPLQLIGKSHIAYDGHRNRSRGVGGMNMGGMGSGLGSGMGGGMGAAGMSGSGALDIMGLMGMPGFGALLGLNAT
jgi:hypothetical protein